MIREGLAGDENVCTDEILNLHFLKNLEVAVVTEPNENVEYSIPCNSSIKFGLIYSPSPYDASASPYMLLKTAGDVMKLKQLPSVVTATQSYDGGSQNKSVSEGEILFVKGTTKAKGKQLTVISASGEEKQLSSKCSGSFSTDPRHTKLHPSVLLTQEIQWPQYVILYPCDREMAMGFPASMNNAPVLVACMRVETSVVATSGENGNFGGECS